MGTPYTWICPGCGAAVTMPADCRAAEERPDDKRLDQLAQALCGCWVISLSDTGVMRLFGAIMGDEGSPSTERRAASGGGV